MPECLIIVSRASAASVHALRHSIVSRAQVPDGDWFCAFNPDPARRSCADPEQTLEDDADGDGRLAILQAPGFVPAGGADGAAAGPDPENRKFFQQLLQQRAAGDTGRSAPMRTVWWLATDAAVPVRSAAERGVRPCTGVDPHGSSPASEAPVA